MGAVLEIILMVLYIAGAIPMSYLQWLFTSILFIASLLRIGSHDAGIIVIFFAIGTLIFGLVTFLADLLLTRRNAGPDTAS